MSLLSALCYGVVSDSVKLCGGLFIWASSGWGSYLGLSIATISLGLSDFVWYTWHPYNPLNGLDSFSAFLTNVGLPRRTMGFQ